MFKHFFDFWMVYITYHSSFGSDAADQKKVALD